MIDLSESSATSASTISHIANASRLRKLLLLTAEDVDGTILCQGGISANLYRGNTR